MNKKKVLVIDDEIDMIELVRMRLEANGYDVLTADNGLDGLSKAQRVCPDLVILDVAMTPMDGYAVLRHIRANEKIKDTPVIMLTAYESMKDLFGMEDISDYIIKPFDTPDFLSRIAKVLKEGN